MAAKWFNSLDTNSRNFPNKADFLLQNLKFKTHRTLLNKQHVWCTKIREKWNGKFWKQSLGYLLNLIKDPTEIRIPSEIDPSLKDFTIQIWSDRTLLTSSWGKKDLFLLIVWSLFWLQSDFVKSYDKTSFKICCMVSKVWLGFFVCDPFRQTLVDVSWKKCWHKCEHDSY